MNLSLCSQIPAFSSSNDLAFEWLRIVPFPAHHSDPDYSRVGKRGGTWPGLVEASPRDLMAEQGGGGGGPLPHGGAEVWEPVEPRPLLTLLPR